jgi:mannose/fructose/N-acetylgalactosamine-specific phosphotransferase system component IID
MFWARWPLFNWGYKRSVGIIDDISGESDFKLLSEAAQILGLTVIGGFVPSMIGVSLKYEYIKEIDGVAQSVRLQDTLDGILPYMLPIVLVAACYALLKKAKWTPVAVIGALAVVCFVLGAVGIL